MRAKNLKCVRCDETKSADQFVNDRTRSSGKFPWCKPCVMETRRGRRDLEREQVKVLAGPGERTCPGCLCSIEGQHRGRMYCSDSCKGRVRNWRTFGLEPDEYRVLIASNEGHCPICRRKPKKWVLDHNHSTGEVTGATCSVCNQTLLAYSRHDPEVVRRLLDYLECPPLTRVVGEVRWVGPEALSAKERAAGWRKTRGYSVGMAQAPYLAGPERHITEEKEAA